MLKRLKDGRPAVAYYLRFFKRYYAFQHLPEVVYYDVDKYVHLHKNVKKHINYCEVLVDKQGRVAFAVPSHSDAVFGGDVRRKAMYMYKTDPCEYCTEKLCDDFGVVMVWYEHAVVGFKRPTEAQVATMYRLYIEKCITTKCWLRFIEKVTRNGGDDGD